MFIEKNALINKQQRIDFTISRWKFWCQSCISFWLVYCRWNENVDEM